MKNILLACALFALLAFSLLQKNATLSGVITDEKTGEPLIGATIIAYQLDSFRNGVITDINGRYHLPLHPGTYDVHVSYTGFAKKIVKGVVLTAQQTTELNAALQSTPLDELVIIGYGTPAVTEDALIRRIESGAVTLKEKRSAPGKSIDAEEKLNGAFLAKKREESVVWYDAEDLSAREVPATTETTVPITTPTNIPRPGLLTAGEWNDLHNWNKHWLDLLADGEIDPYMNQYGIQPKNRYTVLLHNEQGFPAVDVPIILKNDAGATVWEARTDNTGRVELWNGIVDKPASGQLYAFHQQKRLGTLMEAQAGVNQFIVDGDCKATSKAVDIVWAVDATGSMGDELAFLKTELLDVINRVKFINPDLSVRTGSVFYRDEGDDYICKSSALTADAVKTVEYIRQQQAGGGGDYPEAVHTALEEAIGKQPWSSSAVARICFLVLDAAPHTETAVLESIQRSIRLAAQKGIRMVPVSASGIQKDTEFLMKFFGLATNGSYVFLTDHSGIGGKHLEPTTDEYKVEMLNDLLVRLITEYSTVPDCAGKTAIRFIDPQQQTQPTLVPQAFIFPNPATDAFTLELPLHAQKVTLYNAEGVAVRTLNEVAPGQHRIAVNDLPAGYYTLRIWCGVLVQSAKVVKLGV
jgi:hypothetical protein